MAEKLTMRELNGGDIFTMLGILGKLDIKEDVVALLESRFGEEVPALQGHKTKKPTKAELAAQSAAIEKRGMRVMADIGFAILRHVGDAKTDINAFLADLTGKTRQEIESLSMASYTGLLVDFGKKPELKDFFHSIASVLG